MQNRHRALLLTAAAAASALVLTGCGAAGDDSQGAATVESEQMAPDSGMTAPPRSDDYTTTPASTVDRSVIRTADISIRTEQVDDAVEEATTIVAAAGGTLASERRYGTPATNAAGERTPPEQTGEELVPEPGDGQSVYPPPYPYEPAGTRADLTYRVPPEKLDRVLGELAALGTVESRTQQSSDVTEQVVDVDARIASLQASTQRLRELLGRAESVADVAAIEAELTQREAELQSLQARQRSLTDQVAAATIAVHLFDAPAAGEVEPGGFLGGLRSGWDAFVTGLGWLATMFGAALPFLLVLGVPLAALLVIIRRRGNSAGTTGSSGGSGPLGGGAVAAGADSASS